MKTHAQLQNVLASIHHHLPARIEAIRVTLSDERADRGMLRVLLDGALVTECGHGVLGWVGVESAAYLGPDGESVLRAVRRAQRSHP